MALACDLRVAADTAKMGLVETRLAMVVVFRALAVVSDKLRRR